MQPKTANLRVEPGRRAGQSRGQPAATPVEADADNAIADQLRDLITGKKFDRFVSRKDDRAGVEQFYKARDYKPLWLADGKADARAKAAAGYLGQVDTVGLDPQDYPVPDFAAATTPDDLATAELKFTNSVLTYARQAQIGRIHFSRVGADIDFKLDAPEPAEVLAKLAERERRRRSARQLQSAAEGLQGAQEGARRTARQWRPDRQAGEEGRRNPGANVHVPEGGILRPGMKDKRVVALRQRLNVAGDKNNPLYDDAVVEAVKTFQTEQDLDVDGNAGPQHRARAQRREAEAKRAAANPVDTIIVNMERWRWLPRTLGNDDTTMWSSTCRTTRLSLIQRRQGCTGRPRSSPASRPRRRR